MQRIDITMAQHISLTTRLLYERYDLAMNDAIEVISHDDTTLESLKGEDGRL
jgi:hypothetical protein